MSLLPLRLNLLDYISHYGYNLIMNYLFLDMECSNGNDICSFGYVLADENFNVLQQNDVLINPESKFVLTNRAGTQGISLAYDKDEFYAAPKFPDRYEFIKSLVENPENFVVGFAVSNDAGTVFQIFRHPATGRRHSQRGQHPQSSEGDRFIRNRAGRGKYSAQV